MAWHVVMGWEYSPSAGVMSEDLPAIIEDSVPALNFNRCEFGANYLTNGH
jgi:hypothetical protein